MATATTPTSGASAAASFRPFTRWGLGHVWAASAVALIGQVGAFYWLAYPLLETSWLGREGSEVEPGALAACGLCSVGATSMVLVLFGRRGGWRALGPGMESVGMAVRQGIGGYAVVLALAAALRSLAHLVGLGGQALVPGLEVTSEAVFVAMAKTYGAGVLFFVAAVVAPVAEEFLFRAVLLDGFRRHLSFGWANGLQALLFALAHEKLSALPVLFTLAVVAGLMRRHAGGLLPNIVLHGVNNAVAVTYLIRSAAL